MVMATCTMKGLMSQDATTNADREINPATPPHVMQCSEVWGGNEPVERGVVMQGLDAFVFGVPHDGATAGGDIHYVSSCATGRITRVLLADVSGHGIEVAEVAGRLRSIMRRFVNYVDQAKLAGVINQEFARLSSGGHFATAVIATCWGPTGEVEMTNAGHPPPLLYRAKKMEWSVVAAGDRLDGTGPSDLPLGILDDTSYGRWKVRLREGDLLVMYTDALIEAKKPDGDLLGVAGLVDVAQALSDVRGEGLAKLLVDGVIARTAYSVLDDDATVLVLRPNATVPRGSLRQGVQTTRRLLAEFVESLRPGAEGFAWPQIRLDNVLGSFFDRFNQR
jgi:hypothetical protein